MEILVVIIVGAIIVGVVWFIWDIFSLTIGTMKANSRIGRCYLCQSPTSVDCRCELCGRTICGDSSCTIWVNKKDETEWKRSCSRCTTPVR